MSEAIDSVIDGRLGPTLVDFGKVRVLLQEVEGVSIPGVAVVGAQRAGKSYVLEALGILVRC